jgi:RNA 2',3'-cyclic 3'-phosphodiesterase
VRLFVAVYPPPAVLDHLADFVDGLGFHQAGVRATARPLWHLTLAFIGEVPDTKLPAARKALDASVPVAPPTLRLAGGGRFGRGRFTVLWTGVEGDLAPLRKAVTGQLKKARLPFDAKRFHPHLTLARPGDRLPAEVLAEDLARLEGYAGPEWTVEGVALVQSHLGPKPRYDTLHDVPL